MKNSFTIDPTNHYQSISRERILESMGVIPHWISFVNPFTFEEQVRANYPFPMSEMTGGTVDNDGMYSYPEDPVLYPIAKWVRGHETVYMYEYAMISFVDEQANTVKMFRVD